MIKTKLCPIIKNGEIKPLRRTKKRVREEILNRLFPEGIKEVEIWNGFIGFFRKGDNRHLSVERIKVAADKRFKIQKRIKEYFPNTTEQIYIVRQCDLDLLHKITQATWSFSGSHESYARDAIILHGLTLGEIILDWAAQSVITMLLRQINVSLD